MAELNFIELLKQHMDVNGLSIEAISIESGIPQLHIEQVINGNITLTAEQEDDMLIRIGLNFTF